MPVIVFCILSGINWTNIGNKIQEDLAIDCLECLAKLNNLHPYRPQSGHIAACAAFPQSGRSCPENDCFSIFFTIFPKVISF